jgi:repressor LexA
MDRRLTERQREVLDYIREYTTAQGYSPALVEIGSACGAISATAALAHVIALEKKGYVKRDPHRARGIELVDQVATKPSEDKAPLYRLSIVGEIAAGQPIEAYEEKSESLWVEAALARSPSNFVLKVRGLSMIGDGILDGDYVIVQPGSTADNGDTVVALVGGSGVTLKRFYREKGRIRLQPANPYLEPMIVSDVAIQGKVVAVIRRFD